MEDTPVAIPPLTFSELGIGLRGDAASLRERFDSVVDELTMVPLGHTQAARALLIQHRLYDRGEPIGAIDVLLAGTAVTLADPRVLTRNVTSSTASGVSTSSNTESKHISAVPV